MPDNIKRKNPFSNRVLINVWGCALAVIMLGAGVTLGVVGALVVAPQWFGYDATATALAEQAVNLSSTRIVMEQRQRDTFGLQTDIARENAATDAALGNEAALLAQTATQSGGNVLATQTSLAAQSARQRTQIAADATVAQENLNATATQQALRYQQTQAALGEDVSVPDNADNAPLAAQAGASATPPPTSAPLDTPDASILLPPSDTPPPPLVRFDDSFPQGVDTARWQVSGASDWVQTAEGVLATRDNAWLLSNESFDGAYTLTVTLTPGVSSNAVYWLLVGVDTQAGYAVRLSTTGLDAQQVSLYRVERSLLDNPDALTADALTPIETADANGILSQNTRLQVAFDDIRLTVQLNDNPLLSASVSPRAGSVGVVFPNGTELDALTVQPPAD